MDFVQQHRFDQLEMMSLCAFMKASPEHTDLLPVTPKTYDTGLGLHKHVDLWQGVFDAAALGQWIGGIDPIHSERDTRGFVNETAVYSPDKMPVMWSVDEKDRIVPVVKHGATYFRVFNLHIHSKMLHLYVSRKWNTSSDLIQGIKFRNMTDFQVHSKEDAANIVPPDSSEAISVIYVKSDYIDLFFDSVWPRWNGKGVLVTHNSDHGVEKRHLTYLEDPNLLFWFAQNVNVEHSKVQELPIGLANPEFRHGNADALVQTANQYARNRRKFAMYSNFSDTHSSREKVKRFLDNMNVETRYLHREPELLTPEEFWIKLSKFSAVCCPRGNGLDTHRLWETWYLGNVPVLCDQFGTWRAIFRDVTLPRIELGQTQEAWPSLLSKCVYTTWKQATGRKELRFSYWKALIQQRVSKMFHEFDACLMVHPKDFEMLNHTLIGLQRNTFRLRRIFVVTTETGVTQLAAQLKDWLCKSQIQVISENELEPCSMQAILARGFGWRTSWYYQQLVKLHLDQIPGILDKFLILDSDTMIRKPCLFWDHQGRSMFHLFSKEENYYRKHVTRLLPETVPLKMPGKSAVVHHMAMSASRLKQLRRHVAETHSDEFWKIFLDLVSLEDKQKSGASEYELYFQYSMHFHPEECRVRMLKHLNTVNLSVLDANTNHDLISVHSYNTEGKSA